MIQLLIFEHIHDAAVKGIGSFVRVRRADDLCATNRKLGDQQCQCSSLSGSRKALQDGNVGRYALLGASIEKSALLLVQLGLTVPVNTVEFPLLCDFERVAFKIR